MKAHRSKFSAIYLMAVCFCALCIVAWNQVNHFPGLKSPAEMNTQLAYRFVPSNGHLPYQHLRNIAYQPLDSKDLSFGYRDDTFVGRVSMPSGIAKQALLVVDYSLLDYVTVTQVVDEQVVQTWYTGDMLPYSSRPFASRQFVFPLEQADKPAELFVQVRSEGTIKVPLYFSNVTTENRRGQYLGMLGGGYVGLITLMLLVSVMMALVANDRTYRVYVAYVIAIGLFNAQLIGLTFQWLWPSFPRFNASFTTLIIYVSAACQLWFVSSFIGVRTRLVKLLTYVLVGMCLIGVMLSFRPDTYAVLSSLGTLMLVVSSLVCVWLAYTRLRVGNARSSDWYFMAAWLCMLVGIVVTAGGVIGILPASAVVNNATVISSMLEVYFLLAALIDRYNREKNQSNEALQASLLEAQKRERAESHLLFQATHERLSRLPKKEVLLSCWDEKLVHHQKPVSVLIVHYEGYYDQVLSLGQEAAEMVIAAIHGRLREYTKLQGSVPRIDEQWSQDKVVVLDTLDTCFITFDEQELCDPKNLEQLYRVLSEPVSFGTLNLEVKLSIGIARHQDDMEFSHTLRRGQVAAKEAATRNLHHLYYDETEGVDPEHTAKLLTRFQKALQFDGLFMVFQPQIDMVSGDVVGFESLLRWYDVEEGRYQPPDYFMPLVEQSGWVGPLAEYVTRYSCDFLARFGRKYDRRLQISINLSGRNLTDPHLPEKLINIIQSYDISLDQVVFEVTETAFVEDSGMAAMILSRLVDKGVKIALDDFGTGFSSLNYLRNLPFNKLKIDKSYLDDLGQSPHSRVIMEVAVSLGHKLGMEVIAEGVETPEMVDTLLSMGCAICQGYYYAKPLVEAELFEWYATRNSNGTIIE